MGGGNVDTHDARKRMISHGQPSRSGAWGRELHIARWGRAISPHPFGLLARSLASAAAVAMMQLRVPVVISLGSLG